MYGKVFESIYDGSLYGEFEAIVVFKALIVLADERGVIDMSPQALAGRTSYPVEIVNKGLEVLQRPDPDSRSDSDDGRRIIPLDQRTFGWRIVNYMHYRNLASREEKRASDRYRIAEKRNKINDVAECRELSQPVASRREPSQPVAERREPSPEVANVAHTDTDTDTNTKSTPAADVVMVNKQPPDQNTVETTPMCANFKLTDDMQNAASAYWAQKLRYDLDIDRVFARFKSHHIERGTVRTNWALSWQVWYTDEVQLTEGAKNGQHQRSNQPRAPCEQLADERQERERIEQRNVYDQDGNPAPH